MAAERVVCRPRTGLADPSTGLSRRWLPLATRDLLIQRSSLGGLAGVIGAWIEEGDPSGVPEEAPTGSA